MQGFANTDVRIDASWQCALRLVVPVHLYNALIVYTTSRDVNIVKCGE